MDLILFPIPAEHYDAHVKLEAALGGRSEPEAEPEPEETAADRWTAEKVRYWAATSSPSAATVYSHLAAVAPAVQTTTQIVAATGLDVRNVRAVFAGLGKRVNRSTELKGLPWPIEFRWAGEEGSYKMYSTIAQRWLDARRGA
jgi:hypothetical protein